MTTFPRGALLGRRWLWPVRSRARLALPAKELAAVEHLAVQLFCRALRPDEYAGLGGAPDDALVRVAAMGSLLRLEVVDPRRCGYSGAHALFLGRGGPVLASGGHRILDPRRRGQGIGLQMVRRQLITARRLGVRSIVADGVRTATENGYYVGPRLGFDSPLSERVLRSLPGPLRKARCVLDLIESQAGRDWWREHGVELELVFDLRHDSRCWVVFRQYLGEQALRKRSPRGPGTLDFVAEFGQQRGEQ